MTLAAKGSRSITVDDVRYRWSMGRGQGPLSFAVDFPGQTGSVLVVTISDFPRTRWCDDGEGLVVAPALVATVIRLALERGWKPDVRGPQFLLAVQSSELPESVKTVARHFDWCCGQRVMALMGTGKPAASGT
jgi:hypothetical protein